MNMNMQAKEAYLTIYYDYVDGHPAAMSEVKPVWLDAFQCGTSEVSGRTPGAKFDFASTPWVANFDGEVLGAGGHLHDGGTQLDVIVDSKVICSSVPTYGTDEEALQRANIAKSGGIASARPGMSPSRRDLSEQMAIEDMLDEPKGKSQGRARARPAPGPPGAGPPPAKSAAPPAAPAAKSGAAPTAAAAAAAPTAKGGDPPAKAAGGHGGHAGGKHIIAMSICADNKSGIKDIPISPLGIKDLKKGQRWTLRAYYDYAKYSGMKNNFGGQSTVMGISIMYAKTAVKRQA
jgi:hypothetical protein